MNFCLVAGENDLEERYRRSILDIAILQDHIGEVFIEAQLLHTQAEAG